MLRCWQCRKTKFKVLRKAQLESELHKRKLIGNRDKVTVAEIQSKLTQWPKSNTPQTTQDDGLQPLLDGRSPLALRSNEQGSILFVSQHDSLTILKVLDTCTGECLTGNSKPSSLFLEGHVALVLPTEKRQEIFMWQTPRMKVVFA